MARVVEIEAGFVVHKLKIKCAPPRLFYTSSDGEKPVGGHGSYN